MNRIEVTEENVHDLIEQYGDEWWTARDIERTFAVIDQQVHKWSREGGIRKFAMVDGGKGRPNVYNVGDLINERLRRKRSKSFVMKRIGGVLHGCCNKCGEWKVANKDVNASGFYYDKGKGCYYPTCKKCHNSIRFPNERSREIMRRANRRRAKLSRERARAAQQAKLKPVDAATLLAEIEQALPGVTHTAMFSANGLHEDFGRRFLKAVEQGKEVKAETADKLLSALNLQNIAARMIEIEGGGKWHPDNHYCVRCLRVDSPHRNRGLCQSCYLHRNDPDWKRPPINRWSMKYECCVKCGTSEIPHAGRGMCRRCHGREQYRINKERRVGSGHGNPRQPPSSS